jgi:DNA-binding CsgD family transcriptional regulator
MSERVPALLRAVYAAAADQSQWSPALERIGDEFGGGVAGLQYRTGVEGLVRSARFVRIDDRVLAGALSVRNPWVAATQNRFAPGDVYATHQYMALAQLQRTDYYDAVLRPAGLAFGLGGFVFRDGDRVISVTVVRSAAKGPFAPNELARLCPILPHLRRAVQINRRLSDLQRTRDSLVERWDALAHGVAIVDRTGRVVFANRTARAIAADADGLTIGPDGMTAANPHERNRLRLLIAEAVRTSTGAGTIPGGAMAVSRPSQKRPYAVLVAPLPPRDATLPAGMASVFMSDPDARASSPEELVQRLLGLSRAEVRVALTLTATGNVEQTAEALGISRETARWHLKRIFRKTGASGQPALVRQINAAVGRGVAGPAALSPASSGAR